MGILFSKPEICDSCHVESNKIYNKVYKDVAGGSLTEIVYTCIDCYESQECKKKN